MQYSINHIQRYVLYISSGEYTNKKLFFLCIGKVSKYNSSLYYSFGKYSHGIMDYHVFTENLTLNTENRDRISSDTKRITEQKWRSVPNTNSGNIRVYFDQNISHK